MDISEQILEKYEHDVVYCINCGAKCPEGAKFCMKCGFQVVNKAQVESGYRRDEGSAINPDYKKLGGWLAWFTYGHLVAGILCGIAAIYVCFRYAEISRYGMPAGGIVQGLMMLEFILCVVFAIYFIGLFRMIRRRDCRFLHFYEMFMIIMTMIGCGIIVVVMIYQNMKGVGITLKNVRDLLSGIIGFIVGMTYFIKSVRVRTYFGSDEYLEKSIIYRCFYRNKR